MCTDEKVSDIYHHPTVPMYILRVAVVRYILSVERGRDINWLYLGDISR